MINVLVADNHAIAREGLKEILSKGPDIHVKDATDNEIELIEKAGNNNYDVILLDNSLPRTNILTFLKKLKLINSKLPVIVLNMHNEEQNPAPILKAGAAAYLTKDSAPEELFEAIRRAHHGEKYINTSLAQRIAIGLVSKEEKSPLEKLSKREHQVMLMIASGKSLKEVAEELGLSVKTVAYYRSRILIKMKMKNNAEIIRYALKNRLVD
ncbi:MAG: response regulator [Candidatus Aminicenantales bacterium]